MIFRQLNGQMDTFHSTLDYLIAGMVNLMNMHITIDHSVLSISQWKFVLTTVCIPGKLNYLTLTDPSKVWMPDTFFRNEKEAKKHEIIVPNVYVRIYPNGDILYSIR